MSYADNDKPVITKSSLREQSEAIDMKTTLRGNGKGGYVASTEFNGATYVGEGWNEQQAQTKLREKVNVAIKEGKFDTKQTH